MKRVPWALLAAALLVVACREEKAPAPLEGPVDWAASASVDRAEVQVGEALSYTIVLHHPPGNDYLPPSGADFQPFEVIGQTAEEISPVETHLRYRLAAYRLPEALEIPAQSVRYRNEAGELTSLEIGSIGVKLTTSLTPDVTDIHDIKAPLALEVPRDWRIWLVLLAALLAAVLAYVLYRKFRKPPEAATATAWAPPPPPPEIEAETALRRLAAKRLPEKGQFTLFYAELSEIMKRYAGRRFEVPYLERTTDEIVDDLKARKLSGSPEAELRVLLEACDLVKFAKSLPEVEEAASSFRLAQAFLTRTRPRSAPASLGATA